MDLYYGNTKPNEACKPGQDHQEMHHHHDDCNQTYCCCCKQVKKGQKPGEAILKCSCGGSTTIAPGVSASTPLQSPKYIASVTIDTSCLKHPTVLLTFTGDIKRIKKSKDTLNFIIKKSCSCNSCDIPVCNTHSFIDDGSDITSLSYSFQSCECSTCDECCTYSIYLDTDSTSSDGVSVCDAVLTALAVENEC